MNYHQYNPSTDKLEVGTKIRLAGREGEITYIDDSEEPHRTMWQDGNYCWLDLALFTFEIEDLPAKPLTIDKRVKQDLGVILASNDVEYKVLAKALSYLNSLEEAWRKK